MENFYKSLIKKFGTKEGEKFTILHFDVDSAYCYKNCYFDGKGIVNGERGCYFTLNFIFKILNSQYSIIPQDNLDI